MSLAKELHAIDCQKARELSKSLKARISEHKAVGKDFVEDVRKACSLLDKLSNVEANL